jgi:glycosyltransferase involved in cell wall biosynthesis
MSTQAPQSSPLFSVILPTHNRAAMLQRAVAGVLKQTCKDFELIVVDDASTEPYAARLAELGDPRIRVIHNPANMGVAGARNVGIEAARGVYLAFLDDDDEWLSTFLKATHEVLKDTGPDVGMSWSSVIYVDYPPDPGKAPRVRVEEFATRFADKAALVRELLPIAMSFGVTVKRACLDAVGGFDATLRTTEDSDLLLRLVIAGYTPVVIPGVHAVVHNHVGPRLTGVGHNACRIQETERLLNTYAGFLDEYVDARDLLLAHLDRLMRREAGLQAPHH